MNDASTVLAQLWSQAGDDATALERVTLTGADPVLPTDFKIGTAASATIAATGLAASEVWRLRAGRAQSVAVDAREAAAAAVAKWKCQDLEDALAAELLPAGMVRTRAEWQAHPHGQAVAALPLFEIMKLDDAPPRPMSAGARPLSGVRVLDLTRVIAGPVCGRTLASYGADVLYVNNPHLPNTDRLVIGHRGSTSSRRRSISARPTAPHASAS